MPAPEHFVKAVRELLVPVANQEADGCWAPSQAPRQVSGLLVTHGAVGFECIPRNAAAAAHLDEEQHVQPLQPDRLDGEEIDDEQAVSMHAE